MVIVKRESKWRFDTSNGGGISTPTNVVSFAISAGGLFLTSPAGTPWHLKYKSAGVSAGVGKTWVGGSTKEMYSTGKIMILDAFDGTELTVDDLTGPCTIQDVSLLMLRGISATAMFLGLEDKDLLVEAAKDGFALSIVGGIVRDFVEEHDIDVPKVLQSSAKAMLIMGGMVGGMIGAGVSSSFGYVSKPGD